MRDALTPPSTRVPLSTLDRAILYLDRRNQPLHLGCLTLFTPPQDATPDFVPRLRDRLRAATLPLPPFNRRLERRVAGIGWVEDAELDVDQHLVHLVLPEPGGVQDLMAMVSRLHTLHLDRSFPLWRVYLIEGLNDGRIAIYCKMHRVLGDAATGMAHMLRSMSADPQQTGSPICTKSRMNGHAQNGHDLLSTQARSNGGGGLAGGLAQGWLTGLDALVEVLPDIRQTTRDVKSGFAEAVGGRQAPVSILNRRISATREFALWSCALPRIEGLGRHHSCRPNEIVLALCASALCSFFEEQDALPDLPLIAMVPTSTPRCDEDWGVRTVPLLVNLGTDLNDPVERLHRIVRSLEYSRDRYLGLSAAQAHAYTLATSGRGLLNLLFDPSGGKLPFNLVISEVSDPEQQMEQMFGEGCQLDGTYPMPALMDGLALGIAFASRGEWLDFGLVACRRTLPRAQRLPAHLENALKELESRTDRRFAEAPKPERVRPFARSAEFQRRA